MTDKELRKLRREDLLQVMIEQQRQIDALNEQLADARAALEERRIAVEAAGSIADAAMKLNGVFEAAQAAADQYAEEVRARADAIRAEAEAEAAKARRTAEDVLSNARREADRILGDARREAAPAAPQPVETPAPQAEEKRRGLLWRNRRS